MMDKKILIIVVLILILFNTALQNHRYYQELSDLKVRHSNLELCLEFVQDHGIDSRHIELHTAKECADFYLKNPTDIVIEEYN